MSGYAFSSTSDSAFSLRLMPFRLAVGATPALQTDFFFVQSAQSAPHCVTLGVAAPSAPHAPFAYVIRPPPLTYARPRAHAQRCATHVLHTAMRACLHAHERHACICTSDAADAQARGDRRLTCPSISSQRARGINAAEHLVPSSTCFTTSIVLSTVRIDTRGYLCVCVTDRQSDRVCH